MLHDVHGFWLRDAGFEELRPLPALREDLDCELVIVGGGFTGMWLAEMVSGTIEPSQVVVLDADVCGSGPSGRNAGFCHGLTEEAQSLLDEFGPDVARALIDATAAEALGIGEWAAVQGLEIDFRIGGELSVACSDAQDEGWDAFVDAARTLGIADRFDELDPGETGARCDSPVFRRSLFSRDVATLHPGKLSLGLRARLIDLGVRVFERSPVGRIAPRHDAVEVSSGGRTVRARRAVVTAGIASTGFAGLRREATMTSSHMVITRPVPELLERIGWLGGEAVIDRRTLVHYTRTTVDGRIAFGWGGGRIGLGSRPRARQSLDEGVVARVVEDLIRFFPDLSSSDVVHAWGGPIDASPRHLPSVRSLNEGRVLAAFGFTGNGVGPSRSCARLLSQLVLDPGADPGPFAPLLNSNPQRVPPEPFRCLGGNAIMKGLDRVERSGERGLEPGRAARSLAAIPDRLGYRIGR